jgi:hypothetical protein
MVWHVRMLALTLAASLGVGTLGATEPIIRSGWVPNVGQLATGEQPLGDLWTFECPAGGTVTASVDTKDDRDTGQANLDPILELLDGTGQLVAAGDDNLVCTYPPVCGFECAQVVRVLCGADNPHSLLVRDFGVGSTTGITCAGGGGYQLTVEVLDPYGKSVPADSVRLGGSPRRYVPAWALEEGKAPVGPALDDEAVPLRSEREK